MLIGCNNEGTLWTLVGGAVAFGMQYTGQLGEDSEGLFAAWFLVIGALDLIFRLHVVQPKLEKHDPDTSSLKDRLYAFWLTSSLGGTIFYLPAWLVAALMPPWLLYVVGIDHL